MRTLIQKTALATILCLLQCVASFAGHRVSGTVKDASGSLGYVSVSLLNPADSTLALFSITNKEGRFDIPDVTNGPYLLQIAFMGYYTEYRSITVTDSLHDLGSFTLSENKAGQLLNNVVISGDRVPVRVKGDTLEYNASSFKVKPDAAVEDLLRKLPGVQVDKDGNIKSMGKDVTKVLVDGKEFFNDDPKVATKNLPADAIDKIQAFSKQSDASLFTGIDDGSREQTLNLMLKSNKKTGYFGEATAGAGSEGKYDGTLKAFRFRKKSQLAGLGMLNNINKFGFTLQDYMNFNGGISSLMQGGRIELDDETPVDAGQPVSGAIKSGAAAFNYTYEPKTNNRLTVSYMGNGLKKFLDQTTVTQNFTPGSSFDRYEHATRNSSNIANRLAFHWRNQPDSQQLYIIDVHGQTGNTTSDGTSYTQTLAGGAPENYLNSITNSSTVKTEVKGSLSWTKKINRHWPLIQAEVTAGYTNNKNNDQWNNITQYVSSGMQATDQQYMDNKQYTTNCTADFSAVRSLGNGFFLIPSIGGRFEKQSDTRTQGLLGANESPTDSLSPGFYRNVITENTGLQLKKNSKKIQSYLSLKAENVSVTPYLNGTGLYDRNYQYLLPSAFFHENIKNGQTFSLNYATSVTAPQAQQMLPVADYSNPLMITRGNVNLQPEYTHNVNSNYMIFDQFNMSSFYVMLSGSYTKNKIAWSQNVMPDLSQQMTMVNTPYALDARINAQYSRPVHKIGLNVTIGLAEDWSQAVAPVNGTDNLNNTFTHQGELSFSNLASDKLDVRWGAKAQMTEAKYSVDKQMNATYYNYSGFARINYRPVQHWNFSVSADVTHYTAQGFNKPVTIPVVNAEISRYILKNDRGSITLKCFDILDQNKSVFQESQLNYLLQQRSNIIGRYVMLSFGYKLNKAGRKGDMPGTTIEVRGN